MSSLSLRPTLMLSNVGASATAMARSIHVYGFDPPSESTMESYICHDTVGGFESCFVYFLNGGDKSNNLCLVKKCLKLICLHGAVKCAAVLIEKEGLVNLDLNAVLEEEEEDGLSPLHFAAKSLKYGLTKVLLFYGAQPNLPSCNANAKLPLELALESLSCNQYVREWSVEKSFYKLFYILCLPELDEPLKTIKLLALRTEKTELICEQCVKAGDLDKLAALLLMAWDKLRSSNADKAAIEDWPIGQCILKEMRSLADQEMTLPASGSSHNLDLLRDFKIKLEAAWLMLKIFKTSHYYLYSCRETTATWLDRALQRKMHRVSSASTKYKKYVAQRVSGARSFHTSTSPSSSFYKDVKGLVTTTMSTTKVVKPSFVEFLPSARICAQMLFVARTLK